MSAWSDLILAETALQSYWRLGESAGATTAVDSEGAIDGNVVITGSFTFGVPGLIPQDSDTCCSAVGARIECGDNYPFTGTSSFSLEGWIRPDAAALINSAYIFDNGQSSLGEGWSLRILAAGSLRARRSTAVAHDTAESASNLMGAGSIYHVVCTYDGTTLLVYLNGSQVATVASAKVLTDPAYTLTLGSAQGGGNVLTGNYDELAIYNDDLSAAAVLAHYAEGSRKPFRFDNSQFPKAKLRPAVPVRY